MPPARGTPARGGRSTPSRADKRSRGGRGRIPRLRASGTISGPEGDSRGHRHRSPGRSQPSPSRRTRVHKQKAMVRPAAERSRSRSRSRSRIPRTVSLKSRIAGTNPSSSQTARSDRQAEAIQPTHCTDHERAERQQAEAERQGQGDRVEGMLRRLIEPIEDSFPRTQGNHGQESCEDQVDHESFEHSIGMIADSADFVEKLALTRTIDLGPRHAAYESRRATQNCENRGSGSMGMGRDSARAIPRSRYHADVS